MTVLPGSGAFDRVSAAQGVVVQRDGKIVAAGRAADASFGLARFTPDGSLDESFGSGGVVTTRLSDVAEALAVALQPDGKIVVVGGAGPCCFGAPSDFALARYTPDGSLDPGFGIGGTVTTDLGSSSSEEKARAVGIQPDGAIVVAGTSGSHAVVVRYTSSGTLDAGFGAGGVVLVDFGVLPSEGMGLALQPDGKIVVLGATLTAVARLNPDGSFDSGFGSGGRVPPGAFPAMESHAAAVALQPDGKIVVAGDVGGPSRDFALVRYNANGTLDLGFGTGGIAITDFFGAWDSARDLVVQADGKIVAVGVAFARDFPAVYFAVARYHRDGSLDDGFGSGGRVTTLFPGLPFAEAHAVALQPDGRIVAAGVADNLRFGYFALARYLGGPTESQAVAIDIRRGTDANRINLRSKGVITVAILSTTEFDAASVDPLSVRFGPGEATALRGRPHFKDVNGDGTIDLVLHFSTGDAGFAPGTTEGCLTGQTFGGLDVRGCDAVRVR